MADDIIDKVTIKSWFETGDMPTQAQFWATWDSFFHKDDNIPIGSIPGLDSLLTLKADKQYVDNQIGNVIGALDGKVDKIAGKGLSTNDLTDELLEQIGKGMFVPGTDPLNTVYMDGNVGIGTTAPLEKLHVIGKVRADMFQSGVMNQNGDDDSKSLRLRGDGVGFANAYNGDIWKERAGLYTKSGNATPYYWSLFKMSLTGIGMDMPDWNKINRNMDSLFTNSFGITNFVSTGYEGSNNLLGAGWINIHNDMYAGTAITLNDTYLGTQLYWDIKGQIFARGRSYAYGDDTWKKYIWNSTLFNLADSKVNIGMNKGDQKLNVQGNILINTDGGGVVVNSPDGLIKKMISIDNAGNVVAIDV